MIFAATAPIFSKSKGSGKYLSRRSPYGSSTTKIELKVLTVAKFKRYLHLKNGGMGRKRFSG